jgi:hypothetical protein
MRTAGAVVMCAGGHGSSFAQQGASSGSAAEPGTTPVQAEASSPPAHAPSAAAPSTGEGINAGQPPTDTLQELREIETARQGTVDVPEAERPFEFLARKSSELEDAIGLKLGFAYTMLFQQASGGPGNRSGAAGDIDLLARWTVLGKGTKDTGQFVFASEYRFQIGSQPPSALGGQIGTLLGTTNSFTERTMVVKEAYWLQKLAEDHVRIGIGRADPENLVGGHRLQSANTAFFNKAFSTNPTIAYPGSGATAAIMVRPTDNFYIGGGAVNAYSRTTTMEIDELFEEWKLFTFGEIGYTPTIEGLGAGRYRVALWHIDEREKTDAPEDEGVSLILEQDFGPQWQAFARWAYADATVTNVRQVIEAGVGIKGLLGSPDNLTGLAFAWAEPRNGDREEKVFEVFHRWQVTGQSQLTLGVETIFDPVNAPGDDVLGVFSARLRLSF